jgi:hypothetical protein
MHLNGLTYAFRSLYETIDDEQNHVLCSLNLLDHLNTLNAASLFGNTDEKDLLMHG